jgi:hypothetical protein
MCDIFNKISFISYTFFLILACIIFVQPYIFVFLKFYLIVFIFIRDDYFLFDLVFIKKKKRNQIFYYLKNRNRFKPTGFGSVRFFRTKTGSNRLVQFFQFFRFGSVLAWFFSIWLGFLDLDRFFWFNSVFFRFGFGLVRFFWFQAYKTKPNRSVFSKF